MLDAPPLSTEQIWYGTSFFTKVDSAPFPFATKDVKACQRFAPVRIGGGISGEIAVQNEAQIEESLEPMRAALRTAYAAGFADGRQAALDTIFANVQALVPLDDPVRMRPTLISEAIGTANGTSDVKGVGEALPRAPRGLIDDVLEAVLQAKPGMTLEEVEAAVVAADDRIAPKSVYNKLRHWEKQNRKFRRARDQRWYRIGDIPAPFPVVTSSSSREGKSEGGAPSDPFNKMFK